MDHYRFWKEIRIKMDLEILKFAVFFLIERRMLIFSSNESEFQHFAIGITCEKLSLLLFLKIADQVFLVSLTTVPV